MEEQPLQGNFRPVQDLTARRTVFHANPSYSLYSTLLPIRKAPDCQMKKTNDDIKVAKQYDLDAIDTTEIFSVKMKQDTPFKSPEKNKYTISTSIKVNPELLQKLKKPPRTDRSPSPKSTHAQPRNKQQHGEEACLLEDISVIKSSTASPPQQQITRSKIPEPIKKFGTVKQRSSSSKPSQIPRRVISSK